MKWNTIKTYINQETGEILHKKHITNGNYIQIKSETKTTIENEKGTRHITGICIRNPQWKLGI